MSFYITQFRCISRSTSEAGKSSKSKPSEESVLYTSYVMIYLLRDAVHKLLVKEEYIHLGSLIELRRPLILLLGVKIFSGFASFIWLV